MNPIANPVRRREIVPLLVILIVAAGVRLAVPGITEFKRDEANLSRLALDLARGRDLPLLGIRSSANIPNSPVSVYLFALPYAFDSSPVLATLFVGALNVIAVGLTWWLARRYAGPLAAAVTGLLYAASPWAAIYSRKIWAQDLLPPFIVAVVFSGLVGYGENRRWARWLHWPLLVLTIQIHYAAFVLVPLSLLIVALSWRAGRRIHGRDLGIGLGLAALTLLAALIGAVREGWLDPGTLRDALDANPAHTRRISTLALDYAWLTVAGTEIHSLAGPEQFRRYLDSVPHVYPLFKLIPLGAVLAAGWLVWRTARVRSIAMFDAVLVAWLVLPVLAFTWEWTEVAPHYMIPLMPAAYVLCGVGVAALWARLARWRIAALLPVGLVVVIAALQIYLFASLLVFLNEHATPNGFGTPLHRLLDIRAAVLERAPKDVIVVNTDEVIPYAEVPAVWDVLLDEVPTVRFVDGTRTAVIPAAPALELRAHLPDSPTYRTCGDPGGEIFRLRSAPSGFDTGFYTLRFLEPGECGTLTIQAVDPARFANGAILTGYAVNADSLALRWELPGPIDRDYQVFVHLLDADDVRVSQADRPFWPGTYWRTEDTVIAWFDVSVPPEAVTLYAGMYWFGEGEQLRGVEVVDAQGAYLDQGARITLAG